MTLTDTELDRRSTRRCLDKPIDRAVIRTEELRPFARLLVERVADPRIRHDEPALQDFYSRALSAIEAQASRSSGRPEVPVEAAFLATTCMVSAPDLAKAIERASRFYAAMSRAAGCPGRTSLELRVGGADAQLRFYTGGSGAEDPDSFISALLGAAFHVRLFGWLIGEEIEVIAAATSYRQLIPGDALTQLLPWSIAFSTDLGPACDFRVTFGAHHLSRPVLRTGADVESLNLMDLLCRLPPQLSVAVMVRRIFLAALSRGVELPGAARLATLCYRSPATLRRHLARENTSVREIREDCIRARAMQLLQDRDIRLGEVASRLGFSDVPCFRRAFRRWTGGSPAAYRRKLAPTARDYRWHRPGESTSNAREPLGDVC